MGKKKQSCEKILSKTLSNIEEVWYRKIHNNKLTHQKTPADHEVITEKNVNLIECKETTVRKNSSAFKMNRLTQEADLIIFENKFLFTHGYVLFYYCTGDIRESDLYLVPIKNYIKAKKKIGKKSINYLDAKEHFVRFRLGIEPGSMIDRKDLLKRLKK